MLWKPTPQNINDLARNNLFKIFSFTKKNELTKGAAGIAITGRELSDTVIGCQSLGFRYFRQQHNWAPEHLSPSQEELNSLKIGNEDSVVMKKRIKFFNKIDQGFKERKLIIFHLFVMSEKIWHVIYFNEKDSDIKTGNHWKHGPHIHIVNHLWGVSLEDLWNNFPKLPKNGLHIRYDESK